MRVPPALSNVGPQRVLCLEKSYLEGSEVILSRSRAAKANIQSCLLKCLFYIILEKWMETMLLSWLQRDYVMGEIRCTKCLTENSAELRDFLLLWLIFWCPASPSTQLVISYKTQFHQLQSPHCTLGLRTYPSHSWTSVPSYQVPLFPPPTAPGNHFSALCFYEFDLLTHLEPT